MSASCEPDICTGCGRVLDDDSTPDGRCGPCARADARLLDWGAEPEPVAPVAARPSTRITLADIERITGGDVPGASARLVVHDADLGASAPPRWAWQDRLVLGYLNLLVGNEGVGKGTLMCWIIARLTRGELPGDLHGKPIGVGVLGDEDSFSDVWVPRLHAAGADLSRVVQIERPDGGFVNVAEDREKLAQVVRERGLGLLFFDQLLDNLGAGTDDWRQKAVREALQPIRSLARELEIVALGALHPNKRADSFRQLVSGAAAFNAVSRSSLLLAQHPDDESLRVLCRGKGNLSQAPESVEFRIDEQHFRANGYQFKVPLAVGFTAGALTVDDLIAGSEGVREGHSRIAEACEIIDALLPKDGEWHPAREIKEACAADGIDDRMAKRAKERLRIEHRRTSTYPSVTQWRWPPSRDAVGPSVGTVPTGPTSPTENGQKPLLSSSWASGATQDTQDTCPNRVLSAVDGPEAPLTDCQRARLAEPGARLGYRNECHCLDGGEGDGDRCSRCYGWMVQA